MKVIQSPSPNYANRNGYKPELVVVHCTDGYFPGDLKFLQDPKGGAAGPVSSHYLIAPNGDVHQLVQEDKMAWANGRVDKPTAKLKKDLLGKYVNPNLYSISIEVSVRAKEQISTAQDASLKLLIQDICTRNDILQTRDNIIGHREIYSLKTCPGTIELMKYVKIAAGQPVEDREQIKQQIRDLLNKL